MNRPAGQQADDAWVAATTADVDLLDRAGVDEVLAALRRARSRLDAVEVRAARRLRHLAAHGRSESAEHAITSGAGRSGRDAHDVTDREELCEEQPQLEDALDSGDLTATHLDAIRRAAAKLPDELRDEFLGHSDQLLAKARTMSPDAFARECRQLAKFLLAQSRTGMSDADELEAQRAASKVTQWTDKQTGMHNTLIELDPVRDAKLRTAINRAIRRRRSEHEQQGGTPPTWQQQLVEATLDAVTGRRSSRPAAGDDRRAREPGEPPSGEHACSCAVDRAPEISIVADLATLMHLAGASGLCETSDGVPLPVTTVRRLCCDAEIIPTVLRGPADVVDHGRSRRTASRSQRRALRTMYATCAHPECSVGFDSCRIHHVRHWLEHHGPTDLDNLIPLCEKHHHLVHEGGWHLTMTPDRVTRWIRPDGIVSATGPSTNRRPSTASAP